MKKTNPKTQRIKKSLLQVWNKIIPQIHWDALGRLFTTQKNHLMQVCILPKKNKNILIEKRWFNELKAKDCLWKHAKRKELDCYLVKFIYSKYIIWIIPTKVLCFLSQQIYGCRITRYLPKIIRLVSNSLDQGQSGS